MERTIYEVIVLGGGASGLFASTFINKKFAIIDLNQKLGKKILVTGNGRCNLTNTNMSSSFYNQNIDKFLDDFSFRQTLNYFSELGLLTFADEEGRLYPITNSAKSVVDVLTYKVAKNNPDIYLGEKVVCAKKLGDLFEITTDKRVLLSKKLVVALGGNACENIAKEFGVGYTCCTPSLVSLKTKKINHLRNIRLHNVNVSLSVDGKTYSQKGEILFREDGVSGICVFNLSAVLARRKDFSCELCIDLLPDIERQELYSLLDNHKGIFSKMENFFDGLLVPDVAFEIMQRCNISKEMLSNKLSSNELMKMANTIKNLTFEIKGHLENNQVFSGGVKLSDLTCSLESKKVKGLYFVGEACDVDGECGGYNLQWAWTSGKIVGDSI